MPTVNFYYVGDCGPKFYVTCKVAYWLRRTFPFLLLCIGTFGNILNIIVLSRRQIRKYSTNIYVLFLAATDLTVLWTSLVPDTLLGISGYPLDGLSPIFCRLKKWISLTTGAFSTWILVLLTVERTLLTKLPVFSKNKLTPRNAVNVSTICLLVIGIANGHMIFGFRFNQLSELPKWNTTDNSTTTELSCIFSSEEYGKFYTSTWFVIILVLYNLVPATIIIIGNLNIAAVILLQKKRLARVNPTTSTNEADSARKKSSTRILFILSAFYIITTTPWCTYFVIRGQMIQPLSEESFAQWQLFTVIVNILLWCNFTFNFFFYFVSGTLFKSEWNRLFSKVKTRFHRPGGTATTRF